MSRNRQGSRAVHRCLVACLRTVAPDVVLECSSSDEDEVSLAGRESRADFPGVKGSLQLLTSSHLRDRDKMLLRAILCGVWSGFLLGQAKKEDVPCRFGGKRGGDGHLFWECSFPPILHVRELPEFVSIMSFDRSKWSRCLLWHGWLPGLSGAVDRDPWAASFGQLACCELERCLGAYLVDCSDFWTPPDYWGADDLALEMIDAANSWTDDSREDFSSIGGFEVAGASVFLFAPGLAFESAVWGVAKEYGDARLERCRAFMPVPGPCRLNCFAIILAVSTGC